MRCILLAGVAALCAAASATTLVAVWSPTQVLLGADSSVTTDLSFGSSNGSACKIGQQDSSFYAFSGLVDDRVTGYRVEALAREAVAEGGPVEQRLNRFLQLTGEPLARSIALIKRDSPERYEYLQHGHPVLQAIFAFNEQGPPALAVAGFDLTPDGTLASYSKLIASGDDGRGPRIIYAGRQAKIREYLHEHRDWYDGAQSELVRSLIQLEAVNSHGEVGGPIDIVRLTADGAEWINRKAECR